MPAALAPFGGVALADLFADFAGRSGIVLAVSGGADSTALMLLAAQWRDAGGGTPLSVATIDHGLRPEAREECRAVAALAQSFGLPSAILRWRGVKPASRLQERAREARLDLLARAARQAGADAIALAHTLDDQAETLLMRLAHGSGVDGLAGMRRASMRDELALLRPLLGQSKESLVAWLGNAGIPFLEDPSNQDERFERVRARRLLAALAPAGLSAARLGLLAARAARAGDTLDALAERRFTALASPAPSGIGLDAQLFLAEPAELRIRLLARVIEQAGGGTPLRLERLEALEAALVAAIRRPAPIRRTLGGTIIHVSKGRITIADEPPRKRGRSPPLGQS